MSINEPAFVPPNMLQTDQPDGSEQKARTGGLAEAGVPKPRRYVLRWLLFVLVLAIIVGMFLKWNQPPDRFRLVKSYVVSEGYRPMALSPDGRTLVMQSPTDNAFLWDVSSWQSGVMLTAHSVSHVLAYGEKPSGYRSYAYSPDGRYIFASDSSDRPITLWDAETGQELHTFGESVTSAQFSGDGRFLVTQNSTLAGNIKFTCWETATGRSIVTQEIPARLHCFAFSPDSTTIAIQGSALKIYDTNTGGQVGEIPEAGGISVAYSPDGRFLLTVASDSRVNIFSAIDKRLVKTLPHGNFSTGAVSASYSPDGAYIITTSRDQVIRTWNPATGNLTQQFALSQALNPNSGYIYAFSPDGKYLVLGGAAAKLYEVATGRELQTLFDFPCSIGFLAFARDGRTLIIERYEAGFTENGSFMIKGDTPCKMYLWKILP